MMVVDSDLCFYTGCFFNYNVYFLHSFDTFPLILGSMDVVTWGDAKAVTMISSVTHLGPENSKEESCLATRKIKNPNDTWYIARVYRPTIFKEFEKYMGGVDRL